MTTTNWADDARFDQRGNLPQLLPLCAHEQEGPPYAESLCLFRNLRAAYFAANLIAAVTMRAFTMGRSPQRRVIDTVAFVLGGSLIILGLGLIELMRQFDEWIA